MEEEAARILENNLEAFLFIQLAQRIDKTPNEDKPISVHDVVGCPSWEGWRCVSNKLNLSGKENLVCKGAQLLHSRAEDMQSSPSSTANVNKQLKCVWQAMMNGSDDFIAADNEKETEYQPGGAKAAFESSQVLADGGNEERADTNGYSLDIDDFLSKASQMSEDIFESQGDFEVTGNERTEKLGGRKVTVVEVTHPNDPLFNPVWVPKHELRQRVQLSASEDEIEEYSESHGSGGNMKRKRPTFQNQRKPRKKSRHAEVLENFQPSGEGPSRLPECTIPPESGPENAANNSCEDIMDEDGARPSSAGNDGQSNGPDRSPLQSEPNVSEHEVRCNEQAQTSPAESPEPVSYERENLLWRWKGKDGCTSNCWDREKPRRSNNLQKQPHSTSKTLGATLESGHANSEDGNLPLYSDGNSSGLLNDGVEHSFIDHTLGNGLESTNPCQFPMAEGGIATADEGALLDDRTWDSAEVIKMKIIDEEFVFEVNFGIGTRHVSLKALKARVNAHWKVIEYFLRNSQAKARGKAIDVACHQYTP